MRREAKESKSLDLLLPNNEVSKADSLKKQRVQTSDFRASSHKARQTKAIWQIGLHLKKPDLFVSLVFFLKLTNQKRRERRKQHTWVSTWQFMNVGPQTEHLKSLHTHSLMRMGTTQFLLPERRSWSEVKDGSSFTCIITLSALLTLLGLFGWGDFSAHMFVSTNYQPSFISLNTNRVSLFVCLFVCLFRISKETRNDVFL